MAAILDKKNKALYISLSLLAFGAFFDSILIFDIGIFFITSFKIGLLIAGLQLLRYSGLIYTKHRSRLTPFLLLFFIYNLSQIFSLFYTDHLGLGSIINFTLFNIASIFIVFGASHILISKFDNFFLNKILNVLIIIFVLDLSLGLLQMILNNGIITDIGVLPSSEDSLTIIRGFHRERLYFCEFLTIGLSAIILVKKYPNWLIGLLFIAVISLIYGSNSYSGLLGLLALVFTVRKIKITQLLFLPTIIVIMISFVIPYINKHYINESQMILREQRQEVYFEEFAEKNWRIISSITLLNEFIDNPTFFGHGFSENMYYLGSVMSNTFSSATDKDVTSHTFISILYDQGLFGMIVFFLMIGYLIAYSLKGYLLSKREVGNDIFILSRMAIIFSFLTTIRFLVYYQAANQWHFLFAFSFLNASIQLLKSLNYKDKIAGFRAVIR